MPAGTIISTNISPGEKVGPGEAISVIVSTGKPNVSLPSLVYLAEADAIAKIQELGLTYGTTESSNSPNVPQGQVLGVRIGDKQSVTTAPAQVDASSTIHLLVSTGLVDVPDVVGQSVSDATSLLSGAQATVRLQADNSCSGQKVTSQSAKGAMEQKPNVTITYCNG